MLELKHRRIDLRLRHTFRIAHETSDVRQNLLLEIIYDDLVGLGEAAPKARYGQTAASAAAAAAKMITRIDDPRVFATAAAAAAVPGQSAAAAAVDMALYDLAGKRFAVPLYELMGIEPRQTPVTSFTIGIDTPEKVAAKVREAGDYEVLKIKLGSADDRAVLTAVRDTTDRPIRVDANEGWNLASARELLDDLAKMGVEMVEQPLPADQIAETRELRRLSPLPIFADESVHRAIDIPRLAGAFDGINIKLMKCGGIAEALRMIAVARAHGMQVMLGCMVATSLAVTAAAHLSPLVDHADLDGNLLLAEDPFVGVQVAGGRLVLPEAPGLGVVPRPPAGS